MLAPLRIERVHFDHGGIASNRLRDSPQFVDAQRKAGFQRRRADLFVGLAENGKTSQDWQAARDVAR